MAGIQTGKKLEFSRDAPHFGGGGWRCKDAGLSA
jgi:hypothetical protein